MRRVLESPEDLNTLLLGDGEFTPEQMAAITAPLEPAVIVAGAGSGKTTVMTARVVWLVGTGAVRPDQVLGLTFTNKAARELGERVREALKKLDGSSPADDDESTGEPVISTYHAFSGRLLAEHGLRIGLEPSARLLADATRYQLAVRAARKSPGPFPELTGGLASIVTDVLQLGGDLAEHLTGAHDLQKYDRALIAEVEALAKPSAGAKNAAAAARKRIELATLVDAYQAAKAKLDLLDFGDQIAYAARLAEERPEVGEILRDTYRIVLLDEYQDTSIAQQRFLRALFGVPDHQEDTPGRGHPVTAVGDPCQAIYGWRGASVANLDEFPQHFPRLEGDAHRFSLAENRRSGGRLLAFANELSVPLRELHPGVQALSPADGAALDGWMRCALLPTQREEIEWIADQVKAAVGSLRTKKGEALAWRDVAVLARTSKEFAQLQAALVARDVPVEVVGLSGLLDLPEVADLVAVCEVLDEPTANAALVRLLAGPRWRIGARDLAMLGRRAAQLVRVHGDGPDGADARLDAAVSGADPTEVVSLSDALADPGDDLRFSAEARIRFARLASEIRELRRHLGEPLMDLLHRILAVTGLEVELSASPSALAARRRETLHSFLDTAADFADLDGDPSVTAFLAYLRTAQEHDNGLDGSLPGGGDSVKVMTAHKSKGLEWEVVAVPGLVEVAHPGKGGFPSNKTPDKWTGSGKVLPYPLRGDADHLPELPGLTPKDFKAFDAAMKGYKDIEERRLGYVTFTRPKQLLIASGHRWGPTQKSPRKPSSFLTGLRDHCEAGNGEVLGWAEAPEADTQNPEAATAQEIAWPLPLDESALEERRRAALLVYEEMQVLERARRIDHAVEHPVDDDEIPLPEEPAEEPYDEPPPADGHSTPQAPAEEAREHPADDFLSTADMELIDSWDRDFDRLADELRRSRSTVRDVPLPAALSATQLLRLAEDPDALARELARPMPRPPAPAARRGTEFHAWVESRFGEQPLLEPDDLPGAADEEIADDADLAALKEAFARTDYAARKPYRVEAAFQLTLGGRIVRGRIDAVYKTDGGYEVVDWKTNRAQDADPLQLAVYRLAWAELTGLPPERVGAAFLYVRSGEVIRPTGLPGRTELEELFAADEEEEVPEEPEGGEES